MSTTTTYGYKKPQDNDTGLTFWDDLEFNIDRMDGHTHDGVDSAPLAKTQTISSGSWSSLGNGSYRQLVTLPGSLTFDTIAIEMRLSTGHVVHPTIEKVSSTTYYVYTNDNTLTYTAVYI